jgi:hypothetical protein
MIIFENACANSSTVMAGDSYMIIIFLFCILVHDLKIYIYFDYHKTKDVSFYEAIS